MIDVLRHVSSISALFLYICSKIPAAHVLYICHSIYYSSNCTSYLYLVG